jgi:glucose-1-phosphate cytidylyltransferase
MKVVLFCGGFGMRMRMGDDPTPKPMMTIGHRPVLWHIMRYYAHFGHNEFILCLGYGAEKVKEYFLNYQETASNDFVLSNGGRKIDMIQTDISDWRISFVDTGLHSEIGERLRRVRPFLDGDEVFLASYGDVLTDAPLNDLITEFHSRDAAASLMAVPPPGSFHVVHIEPQTDRVTGFQAAKDLAFRINGGFFILRQEIFDYLDEGEDLVSDACRKAAAAGRMISLAYDGFWAPMDTLKDRAYLEDLYFTGASPWTLWRDDHVVPVGASQLVSP